MDFAALETAIETWFRVATGLDQVVWENRARIALARDRAFGILSAPDMVASVGQDYVQLDSVDGDGNLVPNVAGQRTFSVLCKVLNRSQLPNGTGRYFLELARISLKKPTVLEHFQANGIAIVSCGKTTNFDAPFDERVESVAAFTLTLAAAVNASDTPVGTIETIEVSSTVQNTDGTVFPVPPNLDQEPFSVEP